MSKRGAQVYYEETKEEYLEYSGDLMAYQNDMLSYNLPSMSRFLLKHIHALNSFLDEIYSELYERECDRKLEEGLDRFALLNTEYDEEEEEKKALRDTTLGQLEFSLIYKTLFRWHGDIMTREGEEMTGEYAVSYFGSWGSCVRAFHLFICSLTERLHLYTDRSASDHPYCQMVSKRAHVIVSTLPLIEYNVDELWNGMRIITPTLYQYNYSPSMRAYIYALFFRYADLLASQQPEETVDNVFINPLFVIQNEEELLEHDVDEDYSFEAYKKLSIKANSSYSIHNDFVYEGEAIFYHQLFRMHLSDDLIRYHCAPNVAITIRYSQKTKRIDILKLALKQWHEMCVSLTTNTFLRQTIVEKYTNMRTDMHLYHGDRERFKREFPTSAADARDILQEARPLQMAAIVSTQTVVIGDLLTKYKNEYSHLFLELFGNDGDISIIEERVFNEGSDSWIIPSYEQEAMLLTRLITSMYFEMKLVKEFKSMNASFILEELSTLQNIEERTFLRNDKRERTDGVKRKNEWPIFIKLMRIFYVIEPMTEKVFKSLFFAEAYFVWLCLSLRGGLIKQEAIPIELLPLVEKLNILIQC